MRFPKWLLSAAAAVVVSSGIAYAVTINGTNSSGRLQIVEGGYFKMSTTGNITALAGGGQTNAILLTSALNQVTTVATAGDSVILPSCQVGGARDVNPMAGGPVLGNTDGVQIIVSNTSANSLNVFPQPNQAINALGANAAFALAAGKTVSFVCSPAGALWLGNLSA